jgi:hypothetical protein
MNRLLTRRIFRQLLHGEPIHYRGCLRIAAAKRVDPLLPHTQRRSIGFSMGRDFGLGKQEFKVRTSAVALLEASSQLAQHIRTSPPDELVSSLKDFLQASRQCEEMITDRHAAAILSVWQHLREDEAGRALLTEDLATNVLEAMANFDYGRPDAGLLRDEELVKYAFQPAYIDLANELSKFILSDCESKTEAESKVDAIVALVIKCHKNAGYPLETLDILIANPTASLNPENWINIIQAARTNRNALHQIRQIQDALPTEADKEVISLLVTALIEAGETKMALKWLDTYRNRTSSDLGLDSLTKMLLACVKTQNRDAASEILGRGAKLLEGRAGHPAVQDQSKAWWDASLAWAVASGAEFPYIEQLLSEMTRNSVSPDSSTLNAVVKAAYQVGNPDLAYQMRSERQKWNLAEDGYTVVYQLDHRLSQKDLSWAIELWQTIQSQFQDDISRPDMAAMLERLIIADLSTDSPNIELLEDLLDSHKSFSRRFAPQALATLASYHLNCENYEDAVKLLRDHVSHFTVGARKLVMDMLLKFAFASPPDVEHTWNAYLVLTALFEEVDRPVVVRLMEAFFAAHERDQQRRDPDGEEDGDEHGAARRLEQALTAFLFLRTHARPDMRPDESIYLAALRAFSRARSRVGVRKVHNQLKLDTRVDPSPRLHAELMVAYAHCDDADDEPPAAGDGGALRFFWAGMLDAPGGLDEAGVVCALYACERAADGEAGARAVWRDVREKGLRVSQNVFRAYVRALVASGVGEAAMEEVRGAEAKYGFDGGFA